MRKSYPGTDRNFIPRDAEEQEILAAFAASILQLSIKDTATAANATEAAVKNWRAEDNAPGFAKAMRLARRVPKVYRAIREIIDQGGPMVRQDVNFLVAHLAEIAETTSDEMTAMRARRVIAEFARFAE